MTSEPENRIDVSEKEGENFSRGRSVILPDRGRAKVQRSSMMQRSLNESRPLASDDDASFINPGHESEREREREANRELETLKGIFFAVIKFVLK